MPNANRISVPSQNLLPFGRKNVVHEGSTPRKCSAQQTDHFAPPSREGYAVNLHSLASAQAGPVCTGPKHHHRIALLLVFCAEASLTSGFKLGSRCIPEKVRGMLLLGIGLGSSVFRLCPNCPKFDLNGILCQNSCGLLFDLIYFPRRKCQHYNQLW